MNPYADYMAQLAKLYGKEAPDKWRRIMRGMTGDPECREEYEQWARDQERRKNGGSSKQSA